MKEGSNYQFKEYIRTLRRTANLERSQVYRQKLHFAPLPLGSPYFQSAILVAPYTTLPTYVVLPVRVGHASSRVEIEDWPAEIPGDR